MNRSRDYYRKMRAKHIRRKKGISSRYHVRVSIPYYEHDGMYSKNKIHCSCPLCKDKAYMGGHVETIQEKKHSISEREIADEINSMSNSASERAAHTHFMTEAIVEAYEGINAGHGGPFGCVIVKDGIIVGRGHNMVLANNDPTCHGEMQAIRDACSNIGSFDLSGCDLYTTSAPCPMCLGAIQWANIRNIYEGCNVQDAENIGFRDKVFYENPPKTTTVGRLGCLKLFEDYLKTNPTNY